MIIHTPASNTLHSPHTSTVSRRREISVWKEESCGPLRTEPDPEGNNVVVSGTLNQLVVYLTNPDTFDPTFRKTFLVTYTCFTTIEGLLRKLLDRYLYPSQIDAARGRVIQQRVLVFFKSWLSFEKTGIIRWQEMRDVLERFFAVLSNIEKFAEMYDMYLKCLSDEDLEIKPTPTETPNVVITSASGSVKINKMEDLPKFLAATSAEVIAAQLTLVLFDSLKALSHYELLNQVWMKDKDGKPQSPHVNAMVAIFNRAAALVSSAILQETMIKNRVQTVTKAIKIALHLYEMNNFHLLMAFISGLNNSAVSRLKFTFERLPKAAKKTMQTLEQVMSMEGSYKKYRQSIQVISTSCVPYLGVHLTDLTFVEEGNPKFRDQQINFQRHSQVYNIINNIQRCAQVNPPYVADEGVQTYLKNFPSIDDKELYRLSLLREPRNATALSIE